jgi:hypothetical protein
LGSAAGSGVGLAGVGFGFAGAGFAGAGFVAAGSDWRVSVTVSSTATLAAGATGGSSSKFVIAFKSSAAILFSGWSVPPQAASDRVSAAALNPETTFLIPYSLQVVIADHFLAQSAVRVAHMRDPLLRTLDVPFRE